MTYFFTEKGISGTEKDFINIILQFTYDFLYCKEGINIELRISIPENGCINMN